MTDSLRDQLLGLGFKPVVVDRPKPAKPRPPQGPGDRRRDARPGTGARAAGPAAPRPAQDRAPRDRQAPARPPRPSARPEPRRGDIDLAKAYAIRAQREKDERIAAEKQRQEEARQRREARAALDAFLDGKALNDPAADIARHFEYGGKIKRIHVTAAQLKALNAGELGVVQKQGRYLLVSAPVLAEAASIFAAAIALQVDPAAQAGDDPYADPKYQVPDDLVW